MRKAKSTDQTLETENETERLLREALKHKSRFKLLADNVADVIARIRLDGSSDYISPSVKTLLGYEPEEMRGRPAQAFVMPEDEDKVLVTFAALTAGQEEATLELQAQHRDGHPVWVETRFRLLRDDEGKPVEMVAVIRDIAERKALEAQALTARDRLRDQARRAERAEALARLGHWRVDALTGELVWSEIMYELFGLPLGAPVTQERVRAMAHPGDGPAMTRRMELARQGVASQERSLLRITRADGEQRYLMTTVEPERAFNGEITGVIGAALDITELKRAELAIEESEARYRQLAETAHDLILHLDADGRLTYISPSVTPKTGYARDELVGRLCTDLVHPDDAPKVRAALEALKPGRDGRPGKTPQSLEYRVTSKGGRVLWLQACPTPVYDRRTGQMSGYTDVVRDVTQHKTQELALRIARAEAESAAEAKSEFLANMSHELRTPLTSIVGFAGLAAAYPDLPDEVRLYIDRVETASRVLLTAVNDILDFSKLEAGQYDIRPVATELYKLCEGALQIFGAGAADKGLDLRLDFTPPRSSWICVDPDRIRQILLNLLGNALKFTEAGSVTLEVGHFGGRLTLAVRDTGPGIAKDDIGKLFQRFSQVDGSLTRRHGGTGLGLAICRGLVEVMDGEIGVESEPGQGSRFWLTVPAPLAMMPAGEAPPNPVVDKTFAGLCILVADDHATNREIARLFLAGVGAQVIEAPDGETAVALAARQKFDAILMDLRMPRLDGPGALKRIREAEGPNIHTPILAYTADADALSSDALLSHGFQDIIAKPIDPAALLSAVAKAAEASGEERGAERA